jgi:hypothetical protein
MIWTAINTPQGYAAYTSGDWRIELHPAGFGIWRATVFDGDFEAAQFVSEGALKQAQLWVAQEVASRAQGFGDAR